MADSLRILILGGTTFLGPAIVEPALARGHRVTLFHRNRMQRNPFPHLENRVGDRDRGDLDSLREGCWDAVVDTTGYVPAHVRSTAKLLAPRAAHYLFVSSISVYAEPGIADQDEDAPVIQLSDDVIAGMPRIQDAIREYGGMKAHCEQAAEEEMPGRTTVFRPGLIVGPGDPSDRFTYWPARIARGGEIIAPGDGSDPVQVIDVRDFGHWIVHCIERGTVGVFNVVSPPRRYTMRTMLEEIRDELNPAARLHWLNTDFLETETLRPWMDMPVWMPAQGETAGFHRFQTHRAEAAGLHSRDIRATARDTWEWHRAVRAAEDCFGNGRPGLSREREAAVLELWRKIRSRVPIPGA